MPNFALVKPKDVRQPLGLTRTLDYVRGAKHVVTCQAEGLTRTLDYVRGAKHVVTCQAEGRAPAFMNLGLRRSFIKRRSNPIN